MRHFVFAVIVLFALSLAFPVPAAQASRDDRRVVIVDADGDQRPAHVRWNVVVHERGDTVTGAHGTLRITYLDTGEMRVWRVTSAQGQVSGSTAANRQTFLRLLLTPIGPARAAGDAVATAGFVLPSADDRSSRVKVQFTWDIKGTGTFSATGDMVIKGKKILQN